jgi:predicted heme/steroid binding protein
VQSTDREQQLVATKQPFSPPSFDEVDPLLPPRQLQHNKEGDIWIIVDSAVYDMSKFVDLHPGGAHVLLQVAGQGASPPFSSLCTLALILSTPCRRYDRLLRYAQG